MAERDGATCLRDVSVYDFLSAGLLSLLELRCYAADEHEL